MADDESTLTLTRASGEAIPARPIELRGDQLTVEVGAEHTWRMNEQVEALVLSPDRSVILHAPGEVIFSHPGSERGKMRPRMTVKLDPEQDKRLKWALQVLMNRKPGTGPIEPPVGRFRREVPTATGPVVRDPSTRSGFRLGPDARMKRGAFRLGAYAGTVVLLVFLIAAVGQLVRP